MIRFKSIISRIVILHVIAVAITSILMSVALSWLLNLATNNIHNEAMEEQAATLARHLVCGPTAASPLISRKTSRGSTRSPTGDIPMRWSTIRETPCFRR